MDSPSALPAGLAELPAARVLRKAIDNQRIPHAILFFGPSAKALEQLALDLAGLLMESPARNDHDLLRQQPDCIIVRPRNKMRQIAADQVRELIRQVQQTPHSAPRKVVIMADAETLHTSSANIFLKTLEEPPADTVLILLTTRFYSLLDTIRSRCMAFHIGVPDDQSLPESWTEWLTDYREWVTSLADDSAPAPAFRTQPLLALYDLIPRFEAILEEARESLVESSRESAPTNAEPEELDAIQAGIQRGIRLRLLSEIQSASVSLIRDFQSRRAILAGYRVAQELERTRFLFDVNLPTGPAIESLLLQSLRLWASPL